MEMLVIKDLRILSNSLSLRVLNFTRTRVKFFLPIRRKSAPQTASRRTTHLTRFVFLQFKRSAVHFLDLARGGETVALLFEEGVNRSGFASFVSVGI